MTGGDGTAASRLLENRRRASARRAAAMAAAAGGLVALVTVVLCWPGSVPGKLALVAVWNLLPFALLWLVLARILTRPAGWQAAAAGLAAMAAGQAFVLYGAVIQILLANGIRIGGALAEPLYPLTLLFSPLVIGAMGLAVLAAAWIADRRRSSDGG
ncbi:hypothetical protein [Phreatobacter sp.]|uniref:hypothetical protein n=1 Tax=Phreatobacter sp. TaxID=1966341 RepID=UPI003F6EFE2C